MVQYDAWDCDVRRTVPDDYSHHGPGRFVGSKENLSAQRRDFPCGGRHIRGSAVGNSSFGGRIELPSGADARPDRGALSDVAGQTLLILLYDSQSPFLI